MPDRGQNPAEDDNTDGKGKPEPEHHGEVGGAVANVQEALQIVLEDAGDPEGEPQQEHGDRHDPEPPLSRRCHLAGMVTLSMRACPEK